MESIEFKEKLKMTNEERFLTFEDLFEIRCKKCLSTEVDISIDECHECESTIITECNNCGSTYKYHDFKRIETEV